MQYLTIKNRGVCPIEGFTVLGVSTARGNEGSIGQFGSGSKHGVLTCLRMGLNPVIYLDKEKIQFHTEPATLPGGHTYNKVFMKQGTKAPRELSMALEYGELDWDGVEMALREFVSNALDAVDGNPNEVSFKVVERIHPEEGCTVVGIPLTPDVQRFYNELKTRFLHFAGPKEMGKKIIEKQKASPAKVYRKGVLVRDIDEGMNSLFDYNFGSELRIDEACNLDSYSVKASIVTLLCNDDDALGKVLEALSDNGNLLEAELDAYYLKSHLRGSNIKRVWKETFGDKAVLVPSSCLPDMVAGAVTKGFNPIRIHSGSWSSTLAGVGIPSLFSVLDDMNDEGHKISPATTKCQKCCDNVWKFLSVYGLTKGKTKPPVKMFMPVMNGGSTTHGYYKGGVVYISPDSATSKKVMVEELAHYITGACDMTRDFQDYAFRVAAALME